MLELTFTLPNEAALITHGGTFHADDVFSTVIMAKLLKLRNPNQKLTFARVSRVTDDITGFIYDIGYGPYDHHQRGGNGRRGNDVPYAACGLIWRDFGKEYCERSGVPDVDKVWRAVDTLLIQGIDASDCGTLPPLDYAAHPMSVSSMIAQFNPNWNEANDEVAQYAAFMKACELADTIFDKTFNTAASTAAAASAVHEAIAKSHYRIAVLDKFMPWIEGVFELGNKTGDDAEKARKLMYVVYPALRGGYQWRAVPISPNSFAQRNECPVEWRGLSGEELQKVSKIDTATFVHTNGFIGGADTKEDAFSMAFYAVYGVYPDLTIPEEDIPKNAQQLEIARFGACNGEKA